MDLVVKRVPDYPSATADIQRIRQKSDRLHTVIPTRMSKATPGFLDICNTSMHGILRKMGDLVLHRLTPHTVLNHFGA